MRITGGQMGGRILKIPKTGNIRPTQDRVREALFNMIQFEIGGSKFLDLFAGSGAVGLEAYSRGASAVTFVEQDRRHLTILRENAEMLKIPSASYVCSDVYRYLENYEGSPFDIAFADPPYVLGAETGYVGVLESVRARNLVREGGLFIAEMTAVQRADAAPGWELLRDRTYGKTRLCLWRRVSQ